MSVGVGDGGVPCVHLFGYLRTWRERAHCECTMIFIFAAPGTDSGSGTFSPVSQLLCVHRPEQSLVPPVGSPDQSLRAATALASSRRALARGERGWGWQAGPCSPGSEVQQSAVSCGFPLWQQRTSEVSDYLGRSLAGLASLRKGGGIFPKGQTI